MNLIIPQIRRADPAPAFGGMAERASAPSIDLQIDALVFHGFSRADSYRASAAFQQELTRLLAEDSSSIAKPAPSDAAFYDAGAVRTSGAHPEHTGCEAARALLGGLRP